MESRVSEQGKLENYLMARELKSHHLTFRAGFSREKIQVIF